LSSSLAFLGVSTGENSRDEEVGRVDAIGRGSNRGAPGPDDSTAVLGHLLLNSIITLMRAATTLRDQRECLDNAAVETLFEVVAGQGDLLVHVVRALAAGRTVEAFEMLGCPAA
jgi:hypothetical protein